MPTSNTLQSIMTALVATSIFGHPLYVADQVVVSATRVQDPFVIDLFDDPQRNALGRYHGGPLSLPDMMKN
jgi:hypothetical protein